MTDEKLCFVIGPIGKEGTNDRKLADQFLKYVVEEVVEPRGFRAERADKMSQPGLVTRQIMQNIIDADLVVADLTGRNPNVYYELAVRHAIRKPLVQLVRAVDEGLPFDVVDTRTIFFDLNDLDAVEKAKEELGKQVDRMLENPQPLANPISETIDLASYRSSGDDVQVALGQILGALGDLRGELRFSNLPRVRPKYVGVVQADGSIQRVPDSERQSHIVLGGKDIEMYGEPQSQSDQPVGERSFEVADEEETGD